MGLGTFVRGTVYNIVVMSGVMNFLIDYVMPAAKRIGFFKEGPPSEGNFEIVDAKGKTLLVTKVDGKYYPPINADTIRSLPSLPVRREDVLLCGYPKTGCHWVFEILYMLKSGKAQLSPQGKEFGGFIDLMPRIIIDSLRNPRILNTHLVYDDLPSGFQENKTKIILTTRNPKDTVVSFFNHHRNIKQYEYSGEFNEYFDLFMKGETDYGDYFDYWLEWEKAMKTQKDNPILLVPYEKLKVDTLKYVMKMAEFLELSISEQFAKDVIEACNFNKMKKKRDDGSGSNTLYRKGKVGDWENWLTDEQSKAIDKRWAEEMKDCVYQPVM